MQIVVWKVQLFWKQCLLCAKIQKMTRWSNVPGGRAVECGLKPYKGVIEAAEATYQDRLLSESSRLVRAE